MNLRLVFPTEQYEDEWQSIVQEIEDAGEKMTPYSLKASTNNYEEYLRVTRDVSKS